MTKKNTQLKKRLARANAIMRDLVEKNIVIPDLSSDPEGNNFKLKVFRDQITSLAMPYSWSKFTVAVGVSLFNIAASRELAYRFVLEHCLTFKIANVSLVFLANRKEMADELKSSQHVMVLVGDLQVNHEDLYLDLEPEKFVARPEAFISIHDFLCRQNPNAVIVDPLINFVGAISDRNYDPLMAYCAKHDITHVVGVQSYGSMQYMSRVKKNAEKIVQKIKNNLDPGLDLRLKQYLVEPQAAPLTPFELAMRKGAANRFFPVKPDANLETDLGSQHRKAPLINEFGFLPEASLEGSQEGLAL